MRRKNKGKKNCQNRKNQMNKKKEINLKKENQKSNKSNLNLIKRALLKNKKIRKYNKKLMKKS